MALLLAPLGAVAAESSAAAVLARASKAITAAPSVTARFTASNGSSQPVSGELTVADTRFEILTPQLSSWFDGRTQWAYSPDTKEVNITEPTPEELLEVNPVMVLQRMANEFSPRRLKGSATTDVLELLPKKSSQIKRMVVTFNKKTAFPTEIKVTLTDGSTTTLKITSMQAGPNLPLSRFQFPAKKYPGVETIDLR